MFCIHVHNIPSCIEIATDNKCLVHIEMKLIFGIIVAGNKRLKPFYFQELSKRSKRNYRC